MLTNNGAAYKGQAWRNEHHRLAIKHSRTRVRRPQTTCEGVGVLRAA